MRPSALPRANILATLPTMAIAGAPVVALSFASGGGYPTAWNLLTISMVAAGAAVAYVRRPPLGRYELAAIGLLGALTSYSALSYAWSADPPATAAEAQRWLALTATLACLALAARSGGHRAVGAGVAGAAMVVCSYALATRLLPDLLATPHASSVNRLYEPIGYWNGLGELAAVGVVLSLGLAAQASVPGRMVAAAGIVPLSATLYLTFSRGAVLAVIVGVIVAAALEVNRLEWIVRALVLAPAGLASVVVLHSFPALTTAFPPHAAEVRQGALALVTLGLVVVASVAVAYRWAAVSNRCLRSDRARRNAVRGMLITAVLAGVLVVAAAGGPKTFVHALGTSGESAPHFKHGDLNLRLLSLSPNGRSEIWRVAWHDLRAHPVLGSGDGSFAQRWLAARTEDLPAVAAHSLYLETAAELGIVGLLCLITFLALPLVAARLVREAPMVPALAGAFAGALVQQAFDWTWDVTAVTVAVLGCMAGLLAAADRRSGSSVVPGGRALVVGGALALAIAVIGLAASVQLSRAYDAVNAGDYAVARQRATLAARLAPWASSPWRIASYADGKLGNTDRARADARSGLTRATGDWWFWFRLACLTKRGTRRADLARVRSLNPLAPELRHFPVRCGEPLP